MEHNIRQMAASTMFANVESFVELLDHILAHLRTNFFNGAANFFLELWNGLWIIGIHFPFQKTPKEEVQRR